jgi:cytochrome c-type biogenesis protein CcmH/NrfG
MACCLAALLVTASGAATPNTGLKPCATTFFLVARTGAARAVAGLKPCATTFTTAGAASRWIELRSTNFLLAGDATEGELRDVARRLEEFREALSRLVPGARFPAKPTVVLVFANQKSYEPFRPLFRGKPIEAAGFFQPGRDANYVTMALDARADPYPVVFHEFTHLFIDANLAAGPLWFAEGLAEYYSSFRVSDDGKHANVGKVIARHVLLLRTRWVPLDALLAADHDSALYNDSSDRHVFYAESWASVHYLLLGEPARAPQVFTFIDHLAAGTPREEAWRQAFGTSVPALEKELRRYVQQAGFRSQIVTFTEPIASRTGAPAQPLGEAAVEARLGDLLMKMDRQDEAEARLQHALRLDPGQVAAHLSLGELRLQQHKDGEALAYLERATTLDPGSFAAHSAYGEALLRRVGTRPAEAIDAGRRAFARALEIRPDSPKAMAGLAWAYLAADQLMDEAQRLAERAVQADPAEPDHVLLLAQVLARQRDFAGARARLGTLMAWSRTEIREQAREAMAALADYEKSTAAPPGKETVRAGNGVLLFLRVAREGEQRAFGALGRIECESARILFHVTSGDRVLRLSAARMEAVEFISHRDDLNGRIECGARQPPDPVYVTWRPAPASDGEAVAVEFVPKNYVPKAERQR